MTQLGDNLRSPVGGLPEVIRNRMAEIIEDLEKTASRIHGVSSGPRWSDDAASVAAHLSATYEFSGMTKRVRWTLDAQGQVLRQEQA